jgi:hypothetical protein
MEMMSTLSGNKSDPVVSKEGCTEDIRLLLSGKNKVEESSNGSLKPQG